MKKILTVAFLLNCLMSTAQESLNIVPMPAGSKKEKVILIVAFQNHFG